MLYILNANKDPHFLWKIFSEYAKFDMSDSQRYLHLDDLFLSGANIR